jgi:hypothetical protein
MFVPIRLKILYSVYFYHIKPCSLCLCVCACIIYVCMYKSRCENNASTFFLVWHRLVSCLTHHRSTLSRSTRIIGVPVSHVRSAQRNGKMADIVGVLTRQRAATIYYYGRPLSDEVHKRLRASMVRMP